MNQSKALAGISGAEGLCDARLQAALEGYCLKHLSAVQLARLRTSCRQVDFEDAACSSCRAVLCCWSLSYIIVVSDAKALHQPFMHADNAVREVMLASISIRLAFAAPPGEWACCQPQQFQQHFMPMGHLQLSFSLQTCKSCHACYACTFLDSSQHNFLCRPSASRQMVCCQRNWRTAFGKHCIGRTVESIALS